MKSIMGCPFFCSWSGGKDSCFALYHAIRNGGKPQFLFTMLVESGERSRSHGLPIEVLQRQAQSLGMPLIVRSASWDNYEATFVSVLREFEKSGIQFGVFGDIDIEEHRQWCERVCSITNIEAYHPLWKRERHDLLNEFVRLDFKAMIIAVKRGVLDADFLGKTLTSDVIRDIESGGADPSGENGEYHTVVTDGPLFCAPVCLETKEQVSRNGYWFLDVS